MYDDDGLASEGKQLARQLERQPRFSGLTAWIEIAEYAATWLGYVLGALLVSLDKVESIRPLVEQTWTNRNNYTEPLVYLPGELGHALGEALVDGPGGGSRWLSPAWEFLTGSLRDMDWLRDRYPELFAEHEPRRSMAQFDLLLAIGYGIREVRAAAFFTLASDSATQFAARLHHDTDLRRRMAAMIGLTIEEFDERAPQYIRNAHAFTGGITTFPQTVANALETGSGR
jgi:hypothetical protein